MGALNIPSAADVERLTRRLRSVSQRLEGIEDALDRLEERLGGRPRGRRRRSPEVDDRLEEIARDLAALRTPWRPAPSRCRGPRSGSRSPRSRTSRTVSRARPRPPRPAARPAASSPPTSSRRRRPPSSRSLTASRRRRRTSRRAATASSVAASISTTCGARPDPFALARRGGARRTRRWTRPRPGGRRRARARAVSRGRVEPLRPAEGGARAVGADSTARATTRSPSSRPRVERAAGADPDERAGAEVDQLLDHDRRARPAHARWTGRKRLAVARHPV